MPMNPDSPYLPPASHPGLAQVAASPIDVPRTVRVFGILHLIFAVLGLITGIAGIYFLLGLSRTLSEFSANLGPSPEADSQSFLRSIQLQVSFFSLFSIATLLSSVPLAVAGVLSARKRPRGLLWSNIYAVTSLAAKIALPFLWPSIPANDPYAGGMIEGGMIWLALAATYPALTLILLNRRVVKEWASAASGGSPVSSSDA